MDKFSIGRALAQRWHEGVARDGALRMARTLLSDVWQFLRDSSPARRKSRYGDIEYDWETRADTTAANIGSATRFRAAIAGAPYQPTDPGLFREMMAAIPGDISGFVFVDLGSGKGRTLLLALGYPFRAVIGVELLPELHAIAEENIRKLKGQARRCRSIVSLCMDAREFQFPPEPLVVYLFNPLPEAGLAKVIASLEQSLRDTPRRIYVLYHNPLHEEIFALSTALKKIGGTHQYLLYAAGLGGRTNL